jgi:aminoglycoside 3-N-acetyltransferase
MDERPFQTRSQLQEDARELGIGSGDIVMVHAALSRVGRLLNGPDALIGALLDVVGPDGTLMAYTDWDACYDELLDDEGRVPESWREHIPPFDPARSRAARENGIFPEFLRTSLGAMRSASPGASVAAVGARAGWLTRDHPIDYGYGETSPFARLAEAGGKVLMLGAPLDTMTLLHHAEHLARIPGKRVRRYEVPFAAGVDRDKTVWRMVEEFETSLPVVEELSDDYFGTIVTEFLASGSGSTGTIGAAPSVLVPAQGILRFAVDWLERRFVLPSSNS